ncbi:MAG: class I SAM-dependent methyltransferase [Bacteroidota bacterium]
MDKYTEETQQWLDNRFRETSDEGIYFAHQPIYGFRDPNSERYIMNRYIITFQIMKALAHIKFETFLDVGGAEGYKAALVRSLFGAAVRNCDLSQEACERAKEIYGVDGGSVDIHRLPFDDNQFDVVLCSETLEHVTDIKTATYELIRVTKNALIITVPHEPKEVIEKNIKEKIPHAHIHSLEPTSFNFTKNHVQKIITKKILHPILNIPSSIVEANKKEIEKTNYLPLTVKMYNYLIPAFRYLFNEKSAGFLMKIDDYLSKKNFPYDGMIFILFKDINSYVDKVIKEIRTLDIINFKVPYVKLQTNM